MMKLEIKESSKVAIKVINENGKVVEKISVGKRAKVETVKEIATRYDIEAVDYMWKLNSVGGAGAWNALRNISFDTLMNTKALA